MAWSSRMWLLPPISLRIGGRVLKWMQRGCSLCKGTSIPCFFGEICLCKRGNKQDLVLNNPQGFQYSCRLTPVSAPGWWGGTTKPKAQPAPALTFPQPGAMGHQGPPITPWHCRPCCGSGMPGDKGSVVWVIPYSQVQERGRGAAAWRESPGLLLTLPGAVKGIHRDHLWFLCLTPPARMDPESTTDPSNPQASVEANWTHKLCYTL